MIKAIAIDDEPIAIKVIEHFCKDIDFISLEKTFTKAEDGLKHLKKFPADLIFLDIDNTVVVFITSRADYAVEGFNLNALDYLLKPFTFERFKQATDKAKEYFTITNSNKPDHIFLRADYSLQKILLDDILYIEALDDYLKIFLHAQKTLVVRMTMKVILEKLPAENFMRVHRSFIVPIKKVESLRNKTLQLGDKKIPVGNSYEGEVLKHFNQ
jgi:DNA-binding LytR/AlgR family response regulator